MTWCPQEVFVNIRCPGECLKYVPGGGGINAYPGRGRLRLKHTLVEGSTGKKIVFRTLGFILSTLGSVPSNVSLLTKAL